MPNFLRALFRQRPDPIIQEMRQEHRTTMQAIRQLTLEQFKKDLADYSAEIDWENPSGRKPEPLESAAATAAGITDPHPSEPGEPDTEAQPELFATGDDAARGPSY
jgi:hypothetical protein